MYVTVNSSWSCIVVVKLLRVLNCVSFQIPLNSLRWLCFALRNLVSSCSCKVSTWMIYWISCPTNWIDSGLTFPYSSWASLPVLLIQSRSGQVWLCLSRSGSNSVFIEETCCCHTWVKWENFQLLLYISYTTQCTCFVTFLVKCRDLRALCSILAEI